MLLCSTACSGSSSSRPDSAPSAAAAAKPQVQLLLLALQARIPDALLLPAAQDGQRPATTDVASRITGYEERRMVS